MTAVYDSIGSISFPHLGLYFERVGRSFSIFGIEIAYYGVIIAAAMLLGILLVMKIAGWTGQDPDAYFNLAIFTVLAGLVGARIYYVAFSWDYYRDHLTEIWNLRAGGLAIYGGVLAGTAACAWYARRKKIRMLTALDTACVGVVLGQSIGRWGNFFNREAFGDYTDGLLAMRLPSFSVRAEEITEKMWEHAQMQGDAAYIQVHPTFLYESLWNLGVLAILLVITVKGWKRFSGEIFLWYLGLYGIGRFWIEGLRTDQLQLWGSHLPVSQILAAILAVGSLCVLGIMRCRKVSKV